MVKYENCLYLSDGMLYELFPNESIKIAFSSPNYNSGISACPLQIREETRREAALCGATQWVP